MNDREKARVLAGYTPDVNQGQKTKSNSSGSKYNPIQADIDEDDNGKSIRVQMRNKAKEEETRTATKASVLMNSNINAVSTTSSKEMSAVDEWMGKPQKMTMDIIDTQKFAAIVRQKHGLKEKEDKKPVGPAPPPPTLRGARDERDRDVDSKRYGESAKKGLGDLRVELALGGGRGRDRDRLGRDSTRDRRRYAVYSI